MALIETAPAGIDRQHKRSSAIASSAPTAGIDLYWLPLGAGGHSVRLNGKVFEAVAYAT